MATISTRQQIKNKFKSLLTGLQVNNKTPKIYLCSPYSLEEDELPAICIQVRSDDVETNTIGYPRTQERTLSVEVTCLYQATDNLDNIIDDFATIIESKLSQTEEITKLETTTGVIMLNTLGGVEFSEFEEIAQKTGGAVLNYSTLYIIEENNLRQDL